MFTLDEKDIHMYIFVCYNWEVLCLHASSTYILILIIPICRTFHSGGSLTERQLSGVLCIPPGNINNITLNKNNSIQKAVVVSRRCCE